MTLNENLIGIKIEIDLLDDKKILTSQFELIEDEENIVISAPLTEGNVFPLQKNSLFIGYFLMKSNTYTMDLFSFRGRVTGRFRSKNLVSLRVKILGKIEKVQRRLFFRIETTLEVRYNINIGEKEDNQKDWKETLTRNISGGGICMLVEERLDLGAPVECIIRLKDGSIPFKGIITRMDKYDIKSRFTYEAGVKITDIGESERENIVQYVFTEQRRMRQKGII